MPKNTSASAGLPPVRLSTTLERSMAASLWPLLWLMPCSEESAVVVPELGLPLLILSASEGCEDREDREDCRLGDMVVLKSGMMTARTGAGAAQDGRSTLHC